MRTRFRVSAAFMAVIITTAVGASVASPALAGEPVAPSPTPVRYYPTDASEVFGTSGQDQCASPVGERKGAWVCLDQADVRPVNGSTCSFLGCYSYVANYLVEFEGSGVYGSGGVLLGNIEVWVTDRFSGPSSRSHYFQFESTRGVSDIYASGERLYFSTAQPQGAPVSGGSTYREWGGNDYPAYSLVTAFGQTGYLGYENTAAWHGIAHQFWWEDPSSAYDGTWFVWWKSPKFQRAAGYTTTDPPPMGSSWYGSGWHP